MDRQSKTNRYGEPVPDDDREVELDEEPKLPGPTIDPDERILLKKVKLQALRLIG